MTTPNVDNNERETQFLASQNARLDKIRKSSNSNDNDNNHNTSSSSSNNSRYHTIQDQRKAFWSAFKDECSLLSLRLESLQTHNHHHHHNNNNTRNDHQDDTNTNESRNDDVLYVTAQQRNEGLSKLRDIQSVVRALQHYTLDSKKSSDGGEYLPIRFKDQPMPELPVADQRLADIEIQTLKQKSQVVQNVILPKEKFRFHRYRNWIENRTLVVPDSDENKVTKENETHDANIASNKDNPNTSEGTRRITFHGRTLQEKTNCNLVVQNDGTIKSTDPSVSNDIKLEGDTTKSFLVRALDHCQIVIEGMYESIHIKDTKHTVIRITTSVAGPVHVTNCHDTTIYIAFARQLRIHNCTKVSFECHVASGPIIEECSSMKFYRQDYVPEEGHTNSYGKNLYWDVKDFQWLKTLVKSPNFEVFPHAINASCDEVDDSEVISDSDEQNIATNEQEEGSRQDESSDEDEL